MRASKQCLLVTSWLHCLTLKGETQTLARVQTRQGKGFETGVGRGTVQVWVHIDICQRASAGGSHWLPSSVQTKGWCDSHPDWLKQCPSSLREKFGLYLSVAVCGAGLGVNRCKIQERQNLNLTTLLPIIFSVRCLWLHQAATKLVLSKTPYRELEASLLFCPELSTAYAGRKSYSQARQRHGSLALWTLAALHVLSVLNSVLPPELIPPC